MKILSFWNRMNLPNKLTLIRILLVPLFVLFMMLSFPAARYIALVIFIVASLTDTADGFIARRYNLITNFGKFMDPLADKLLVCSALICFVHTREIPAWIVIIIIAREFIISGFRLVAAESGVVIAASWWGKIKTIFQMVMVIFLLCNFRFEKAHLIGQILIYASLSLTVISLVDYLCKNRGVLAGDI